jgi:hypothetical protein
VEPLWQGWHHYRLASPPEAHLGSGTSAPNPKPAISLAKGSCAHHPDAICGAHARADTATRRNMALVPGDQDQRHLEEERTACNHH